MAQYVYTLMSLAVSCSMRQEISPCTCNVHSTAASQLRLECDGVDSFNRVYDALQNRFSQDSRIQLVVNRSQLEDLETKTFSGMNLVLHTLKLTSNNLKTIPESTFYNLSKLEWLSLNDNLLDEVPRHIFPHMPRLGTLDLGSQWIRRVRIDDFRRLPRIEYLLMYQNVIDELEVGSIPSTIKCLHLAHNNLTTLNGTIRHLPGLRLLFVNNNKLTTLDGELPMHSTTLFSMLAHYNSITHMPEDIRTMTALKYLYIHHNRMRTLGGRLRHNRVLEILEVHDNEIETLASDEFQECVNLENIDLSCNRISSINGSLLPMMTLKTANVSFNLLTDFSLSEIRGLKKLRVVDLSHNRIERLTGKLINNVEPKLFVLEIRLEHNRLKTLDGALMGLTRLRNLNLAHNQLSALSPDDLIGLEDLVLLDISHNQLTTLEETSKSFLPNLTKLIASHNLLTKLDKDFHGLPNLCFADLSSNQIVAISPNLADKTSCYSHSVFSKLDILLQNNPILCRKDFPEIYRILYDQDARINGMSHCIQNSETMVVRPPPPLPIPILYDAPLLHNAIAHLPPDTPAEQPATTIASTTSTTVAPDVPVPVSTSTMSPLLTIMPADIQYVAESNNVELSPPTVVLIDALPATTSDQQPEAAVGATTPADGIWNNLVQPMDEVPVGAIDDEIQQSDIIPLPDNPPGVDGPTQIGSLPMPVEMPVEAVGTAPSIETTVDGTTNAGDAPLMAADQPAVVGEADLEPGPLPQALLTPSDDSQLT